MATATPCIDQQTACTPPLFLAFELGENKWKLGCTTGAAQRPRERQVAAGECATVLEEMRRAKQRLGLPDTTRVGSCYAAGRDGFWRHRC
jgi:transposase